MKSIWSKARQTAVVLGAVALLSCADRVRAFEKDEACVDVGYSIAARTLQCSGDPDLANSRYEAFDRAYSCTAPSPQTTEYARFFHCSISVNRLSCDAVEQLGDELDRWLEASPICPQILEHADGSPLAGADAGAAGAAGAAGGGQ